MRTRASRLWGPAARVAAVVALILMALYAAAVVVLDVVVVRRLDHQIDTRLRARLTEPTVRNLGTATSGASPAGLPERAHDVDDAPVFLWSVAADGTATALQSNGPSLPTRTWQVDRPVSLHLGTSPFRFEAVRRGPGWLVAGQSEAEVAHVRTVFLASEAAVGPLMVLAVYFGSLIIGLRAAAPVEAARRRQLEFTADASHELRTPLSVIDAEVGLALSSPRDASYYEGTLGRIGAESARLRRLVEDLLWLARFDAEPPPPSSEPVDLVTLAASTVERFGAPARARRLGLELAADESTTVLVRVPPEWCERLLGVLVDNACRYTPPGGRVEVEVGVRGSRAFVAVDDDGPGIPAGERERLFDRFHRATDVPGGAGLGLAIADAIVRSTGGRWRIGDSARGGARMEVSWHGHGGREAPAPTLAGVSGR